MTCYFLVCLRRGRCCRTLKDKDGKTPLSWAAYKGHDVVVKVLLETGKVDIDVKDNDGRTPLLCAVYGGH
jgi:ankyrin repeat protein